LYLKKCKTTYLNFNIGGGTSKTKIKYNNKVELELEERLKHLKVGGLLLNYILT
jgi:hypothetical protein